ncbi:cupin domain-containing protein [Alteromonas sp. ASW11-36]|uniref:Cupin domain-containing protein n=1 Tax=Alteromonas arenosi TaxID=3055817 RepID=A0ABT7SWK3_9ALTE|nr:cupin domain-containing protein [Alteromonas sp. ASW11-36]MDM7860575.1 cupin domain-containing protein [Alteromonas sp. ASW11-36]
MNAILNETFSVKEFKAKYWQKKPCLLRGLMPGFHDPIDEHDLAGLAQEPEVDSRIVSVDEHGHWQTTSGPFDDFDAVFTGSWTLLVQGTERYFGDVDKLLSTFDFIPYWRTDDVMISYSTMGAGVGAHVDQYDVFLIQGKGQRHWQVGKPDLQSIEFNNNGLRQVDEFEPMIDCITVCGDVLYIPPGWPHKGQTIESALTYSIGFRAPNNELLADILTEGLSNNLIENKRYTDASPDFAMHPAEITSREVDALVKQLKHAIDTAAYQHHLIVRMSEQELSPYPTEEFNLQVIIERLASTDTLNRLEGLRPLYLVSDDPQQCFAVNGEAFQCPRAYWDSLVPLLNNSVTELPNAIPSEQIKGIAKVLLPLCQAGYYWFE